MSDVFFIFFSLHFVANKGLFIGYVDKMMYLRAFLTTGRQFKSSFREPISKFYKSVNSIIYRSKENMDDMILLVLFYRCFVMHSMQFHWLTVNEVQ